jgi:hypothetical protein
LMVTDARATSGFAVRPSAFRSCVKSDRH